MSRKVLKRYKEIQNFENVSEIPLLKKRSYIRLPKHKKTILELACGYGEYTNALAERFPDSFFIGIDIQGERIWKGAKLAHEMGLRNVLFIRTDIRQLDKIFKKKSINELWITFPDPQPSKPRKRLTYNTFLDHYKYVLKQGGCVHLKTDDQELYEFTLGQLTDHKATILRNTNDLYGSPYLDDILSISTRYEKKFGHKGIKYIAWTY